MLADWYMLRTYHGQDLVIRQDCLLAQFEQLELLYPPDDADPFALLVLHVLLRAEPLACGDLVLVVRCSRQPVVAGRELDIETPHHAVLVMNALGEIGVRRS